MDSRISVPRERGKDGVARRARVERARARAKAKDVASQPALSPLDVLRTAVGAMHGSSCEQVPKVAEVQVVVLEHLTVVDGAVDEAEVWIRRGRTRNEAKACALTKDGCQISKYLVFGIYSREGLCVVGVYAHQRLSHAYINCFFVFVSSCVWTRIFTYR